MVIILTGTQSINKKFLARIVLASLNTFEYKGYTCDFTHSDIKIYDANKTLVYKLSSIAGGIIGQDEPTAVEITKDGELPDVNIGEDDGVEDLLHTAPDVIEYFLKLNKDIFEDGIKVSHYIDTFVSLDYEFGITDTPIFVKHPNTNLKHAHTFEDVVNGIKNSPLEVKVITGTFGSAFLDMIKEALPSEEIHVVNIIRNPSVSWLMNKKPETKWLREPNPHLTEFIDNERFYDALINAIEIGKRSDVSTIRFEDMMVSGKLSMTPDIEISVRDDYRASNQWISVYESAMNILMSDDEFAPFNAKALNYTFEQFYAPSEDLDEEELYGMPRDQMMAKAATHFPKNLFADLGYEPVDKVTILS